MTVEGFSSVICHVKEDPEARSLHRAVWSYVIVIYGEQHLPRGHQFEELKHKLLFWLKLHSVKLTLIVFKKINSMKFSLS